MPECGVFCSCIQQASLTEHTSTILFAGHETTSTSISWALLELARHPQAQARLLQEILKNKSGRGGAELTVADLDNMPYLQAVLKEVLRIHPILNQNFRLAVKDDVLPLTSPVTTKSGKVVTKLPIPKGTRVILSIAAYNRYVVHKLPLSIL